MSEMQVEINTKNEDKVFKTVLSDGLKVYICPKKGFSKKIGMYGTHYGSIDTTFFDVVDGKKRTVPEGIAHFLEHKLFEQEDGNALDLFAQKGVSSNAYTSFDHTVYFFETDSKFEECVKTLFDFITKPYFTDENVEKEKGIIEQEIKMYEDAPDAVVYYNVLKGMYNKYPLNIDIAGTVESVYSITKEHLYSCYNTFYNPANMFVIIIGDVNIEETLVLIEKSHKSTNTRASVIPQRYYDAEEDKIAIKEINNNLDIYMPSVCIGYKMGKKNGKENIRNAVICEIIEKCCFGNLSEFYEELYNKGYITTPMYLSYESGVDFSHNIISFNSLKYKECEEILFEYINKLKQNGISKDIFDIVKNKIIGEIVFSSEELMHVSRDIIDSIIENTDVFEKANMLDSITINDVNEYIKKNFNEEFMAISRVLPKN
ncbi:MAG: insulinase family protein [Clostridia bacterium]|nr:insulinase family protein [Clostridia bacterium]